MHNITASVGGATHGATSHVKCDEVSVRHDHSKTTIVGQSAYNNLKMCRRDARLRIPTWSNVMRMMVPDWMDLEENGDEFFFTMSDGRVLDKSVINTLLRESAIRLKLNPDDLGTHSLRAGGCSAMHDAKRPEHEIQRRGRWISNCWKLYCWPSRVHDDGLADAMAAASSKLFTHLS